MNKDMRVVDAIRQAIDETDDANHTEVLDAQLACITDREPEDMAPYESWTDPIIPLEIHIQGYE